MSTTFGVRVKSIHTFSDAEELEWAEIAFRNNSGDMMWKEPLAQLLPDDLLVVASDNAPQGIYTIMDIKNEINRSKSKNR